MQVDPDPIELVTRLRDFAGKWRGYSSPADWETLARRALANGARYNEIGDRRRANCCAAFAQFCALEAGYASAR